MAKFLIISGDHERHLFVHKNVIDIFDDDVLVVCMRREPTLPVCPDGYSLTDQENFKKHFKDRLDVEHREFGVLEPASIFSGCNTFFVDPENLSGVEVANLVTTFNRTQRLCLECMT